ncbi:MAG TPA: hypothetical protein VMC84_11380 [Methanocella sp.]|uniref:hypothetical protein n=1 Tax=Methanocella sp. TaxID=2052833 RepID=UPI002CCB771B|nr:hypothetical protein [Methanocella sp.]HTY91768.1 hypothetical protein [Methanocella sp.]
MLLESMNGISGMLANGALELVRNIQAFAVQIIDLLGGTRGIESLLVIGFTIGMLACLYEIKKING